MDHWRDYPMSALRRESHFGDRVVICFAQRPPHLNAMFAATVAVHGAREAMVFEGRRWTWRELDAEVARVAAGFAAGGIAQGDRVVLFLGNLPEFIFSLHALQRLGAVVVPVSVREQKPGLEYILNQCGARGIVYEASLAERLPDAAAAPSVALRIAVGPAFEALKAHGAIDTAVPVQEEDTAFILYTSGTTGRPKGAMLTHFNVVHSALHFEACMKLTCEDRSALAVPASHVTGIVAAIATMLRIGGALVVMREFKAAAYIREAAAERVTYTILVPAMYNLILLQPEFGQHDLSHWRVGGYGGAPMPVSTIDTLAQKLPNLILTNAYGATESTSPATIMPVGATRAHADTVGVTVPCGDIRIMDEAGCEVAPGETGEIWIGGPMMVKGYWDNTEATAREFTGGYWHSGDLGSKDADGYVRIFDRKKDMLNRGGFKIYSVEVENVLMGIAGVVEAAVVGVPCPVLGERVHAFVNAPTGAALRAEMVRSHCAAHLADYKVPETVTIVDAPLPRNANGKLLKRVLREQMAEPGR
jgi:O-succinylbenzoic acid--CoA ligase